MVHDHQVRASAVRLFREQRGRLELEDALIGTSALPSSGVRRPKPSPGRAIRVTTRSPVGPRDEPSRPFALSCRDHEGPTMEVGGANVALWWFVECGRCGYSGCAAPIGECCPNCGVPLETETSAREDAT